MIFSLAVSDPHELVITTPRRKQKGERFGRDRIRVETVVRVVVRAPCASVDLAKLAQHVGLSRAVCVAVGRVRLHPDLRFDHAGKPERRQVGADVLNRRFLDEDDALGAGEVLLDAFANAGQEIVEPPVGRLRGDTQRQPREGRSDREVRSGSV